MRSRHALAAVPLAVLAVVGGTAPGPVGAQDEPVVVTIGLHAAEKNLNPFISPQALPITHDFTMLVYDSLFWSQARLDPEPWLATGAEPSDDFRSWTVSLREGVTWHDGEEFTADDVAFTFEYFADGERQGRYGHHVWEHPQFESAEVVSPLTVTLNFAEPVPSFELLPGGDLPIIPEHIWAGVVDPEADATSLQVGTGPFRMTEYVPDTSYRLEANEDYFFGAPTVDVLELPVVRDAQAAFAGLQSGELDFVTRNLPAPLVEGVEGNDTLDIIEGTRFESLYLSFNTRQPMLDDPIVRQAISRSLDLDTIVELVEGGLARPGNDTWTHPDSPWAHPEGGHVFDVDAANQMLDDAGYARTRDGTRVAPDGTPLAFTLLANSFAPPQLRSAELVAEQAGAIGVTITVESLDPAAITAARRPPAPGESPPVDMFLAVFESHAHADPDHLYFFFHSPGQGVGATVSGIADPELDAIMEESLATPPEDRLPQMEEAQDRFAEVVPAVTLYYPDGRWAYNVDAYDGWISDPGHGVFTKRSFLADANIDGEEVGVDEAAGDQAAPAEDAAGETAAAVGAVDDGPSAGLVIAVVAGLMALAAAVALKGPKGDRAGTVED
jgi:peptide/nickel transport system substrate-binding protein